MTSDRLAVACLAAGLAGCSSVKQEEGLSVDVTVQGEAADASLLAASVSVRSVELVPCMVAWSPLDLLGAPARADHSIESPTIAAFASPTDLLGQGVTVTVTPPPDAYCYARFVLEPIGGSSDEGAATVSAELASGVVSSDQVAWLDLPVDFSLTEDTPHAALNLAFVLSDWPVAAEQGPEVLFATARESTTLHQQ